MPPLGRIPNNADIEEDPFVGDGWLQPRRDVEFIEDELNQLMHEKKNNESKAKVEFDKRVREANAQRPDKHIAILLDTKGPEIRTGFFREDVGSKITLTAGQDLKLTTDYDFKGDSPEELVFFEGDKIELIEEFSDGWAQGRLCDDTRGTGLFPLNYTMGKGGRV